MVWIGLLVAVIVTVILDVSLVSMSRKKQKATEASAYITDALELTHQTDTYLRTSTTSVKINRK